MWNPTARALHSRTGLRYGSDLTDAEWAIVAPLLPKPCDRGRRRRWHWHEVLDAIFYVLRTGCPWRFLPDGFLPWRTVSSSYQNIVSRPDQRGVFKTIGATHQAFTD